MNYVLVYTNIPNWRDFLSPSPRPIPFPLVVWGKRIPSVTIENRSIHKMVRCSDCEEHTRRATEQPMKHNQQIAKQRQWNNGTEK